MRFYVDLYSAFPDYIKPPRETNGPKSGLALSYVDWVKAKRVSRFRRQHPEIKTFADLHAEISRVHPSILVSTPVTNATMTEKKRKWAELHINDKTVIIKCLNHQHGPLVADNDTKTVSGKDWKREWMPNDGLWIRQTSPTNGHKNDTATYELFALQISHFTR